MSSDAGSATPAAPPPAAGAPRPVVRRRGGRAGLYTIVGVIALVAILVGAGWATGWYGLVSSSSTSSTTLEGYGASFLNPLLSQWEVDYASSSSNRVNYVSETAVAGIEALASGTADFAATDEPVTPSELSTMPGPILTLPVTGGALAIVYNIPSLSGTLNLTGVDLADIYLGTITNWDDPGLAANTSGLPDHQILPVVRSGSAGTNFVLTNFLSDDSSAWASGPGTTVDPTWPTVSGETGESSNSALAKYVAETPYTIGYVDLADAESNHLPTAGVLDPHRPVWQFVQPTVADTQAAVNYFANDSFPLPSGNWSGVSWVNANASGDYPLAIVCYFLVFENAALGYSPSPARAEALVQWLDWVVVSGPSTSASLDYINPPATLLAADALAVAGITYNGAQIP